MTEVNGLCIVYVSEKDFLYFDSIVDSFDDAMENHRFEFFTFCDVCCRYRGREILKFLGRL